MNNSNILRRLVVLVCAGLVPGTGVTCDPYSGTFGVYFQREIRHHPDYHYYGGCHDHFCYDGYYYLDRYYHDCWFGC